MHARHVQNLHRQRRCVHVSARRYSARWQSSICNCNQLHRLVTCVFTCLASAAAGIDAIDIPKQLCARVAVHRGASQFGERSAGCIHANTVCIVVSEFLYASSQHSSPRSKDMPADRGTSVQAMQTSLASSFVRNIRAS